MPSILVATGFVRIESDTRPALKALQAFGALGGQALSTGILPAAAAATVAIGGIASAAAVAGGAVTAYGVAVGQQFGQIKEVMTKQTAADDAQTKATNSKAIAQKLAREMGIKYGQEIKITAGMTQDAKDKAEAYNSALSQAQSASKAATLAQQGYKSAMGQLPPATEKTAEALQNLKSSTKSWSDSLAGSTMPVFTKGIQALENLLPKLSPLVRNVAHEIDGFVSTLGEGVAGKVFKEFGKNIQANGAGALRTFLDVARNLTVGIVGVLNAFMPMSVGVTGGLEKLTEKFANWGATLGKSGGFQRFMDIAKDAGPRLVELFKSLATAFLDVASAAGPLSGIGLTLLTIFAQLVDAIPTPVLQLLVPAIIAVNTAMKLWAIYQSAAAAATWLFTTAVTTNSGIVASSRAVLALYYAQMLVVRTATAIATAAQWLWNAAFAASGIGLIVIGIAALVAAIIWVATKTTWFQTIWKYTWDFLKMIGRWFAGPFTDFFKAAWDQIYKWLIKPYVDFFTKVLPAAARFLKDQVMAQVNLIASGLKAVWDFIYKWVVGPWVDIFTQTIPAAARALRDRATLAVTILRDRLLAIWDFINRRFVQPNIVAFTQTIPNAARALRDRAAAAASILRDRLLSVWDFINRRFVRPNVVAFTQTIPNAARALRDRVVGFGNSMRDGLSGAWNSVRNRTLSPMQSFFTKSVPGWAKTMRDRVVGFFGSMRDGVGVAWSGIRDKARSPINWVLDHVWNRGIVPTWGRITGWIGIKNTLKSVKMLASGGTVGNEPFGMFNRPTAIVGEGNPMYPEFVIPTDPKYKSRAKSLWQMAGGHFMEDGGILGKIGGWLGSAASSVTGAAKGAADFLTDPVAKAKKMLLGTLKGGNLGSSPWAKLATRLPRLAVDGLLEAVKKVGGSFLGAIGLGPSGGSGVKRWTQVVLTALRMVGQVPALLNITLRRMNQESGGNPNIVNKWDSNWKAGHPSVGLMQVIGPTFRAYAGKLKNTGPFLYGTSVNPLANVYASMRYALSRYGSLSAAYGRAGGYANGTAGTTSGWHMFGERGPEMGYSPAGWRILNNRQTNGLGGGPSVTVERLVLENHGVIASRQEAENWLVEGLENLSRKNRLPVSIKGK
jgi:SLT domain-containing protein